MPLLVIWLLIDRWRPRWYVPVLVLVLFTLTMVGNSVVVLTGIAPLVLVGVGRGLTELIRRGIRHAPAWYELSLAAAAAAAGVAGSYGPRVMAALGGYQQSPVEADTDLSQLQHGSWVTLQAFLELFGANIVNPSSSAPGRRRRPSSCRCTWPGRSWRSAASASAWCGSSGLAS